LIAEYSSEISFVDVLNSVRLYKDALNIYAFWEETWVQAARAWQKLNIDVHDIYADEKSL
jgi:hypothetical protein